MEPKSNSGSSPVKPRFKLSTQITAIVFWCLALVGLACSMYLLKDVEHEIIEERQATVERFTYRVEWAMFDALSERGPNDISKKLESLSLRFGVVGVVLHSGGETILAGDTRYQYEKVVRNIYMDRSSRSEQTPAASLNLYFPQISDLVKQRREKILFSMGVLFLSFGVALQMLLSRVLTQPMQRMVDTAQAISEGKTGQRFDESNGDEFGYLSGFINQALTDLSYQASHDPVTGLYNRREFQRVLQRAVQLAQRDGQTHALCYLDLDRFKLINDTCGHTAGDEFLQSLSAHLRQNMRKSDVLARLGGDEFAMLLQNCPMNRAATVADELRENVQNFRFIWEEKCFQVGVSIGLAEISASSDSVAQAMSNADMACYAAKKAGRNRVHIYQQGDAEVNQCRNEIALISQIKTALEEDRFELYFQPIRAVLDESEPDRYELLLRMNSPNGELVMPDRFIPVAERYDLMPQIDQWVVEQACQYLKKHELGNWKGGLTVNLSGKSLSEPQFLEMIIQTVSDGEINPGCLCFEITETVAITNLVAVHRFMHQLHEMGCQFALDDFGSGLSSFSYLKNLPVDYLKIDGSFVRNIHNNKTDQAMVEAINRVGQVLGMQMIAEFVDKAEVFAELQRLGVDYAQGYWIAEPKPLAQLAALLKEDDVLCEVFPEPQMSVS